MGLFDFLRKYNVVTDDVLEKEIMGLFDFLRGKKHNIIPDDVLEISYNNLIASFIEGKHSSSFNSNVLLKKGEVLIFDIPGISYCEEKSVKIKGNTRGFSIRLTKGVSYNFGQFEGGVEQKVTQLDSGILTLTSKRLIFSGRAESIEYSLSKIISLNPLDNGIMINRTGKTKTEYFLNTTNLSVNIKITPYEREGFKEDTIEWSLNGNEFKKIIQNLIQ
ncbi:hypothetical protein [Ichthyobacterium seriolicida]|uniref:Uncharacterized protein n=1 Tax=Ichthyobacterium seriolicida TaxID=242600 RepID=A0A1J1DYM1_9FLAO|nr:hypothetical protein [Ichthyobacterium seriolicida]BAV94985.1 hypothetical protein JBKA6_0972 [Ichthyobacterium seriolicida]